jgi:D-aminopeptidase
LAFRGATGAHNAITDVRGVSVGHVTVWHGHAATTSGSPTDRVARTGVTAIVPVAGDAGDDVNDRLHALYSRPIAAGTAVLNGAGELTGSIEVAEWGILETPILLTGTSSVGRAYDAAVDAMYAAGADEVVIPVVGECDDSWLDDHRRRWVTTDHARDAIAAAASGPVAEGSVGAGTGMITMGHKAGIGTSSRLVDGIGTVGVLVLANFGAVDDLRVGGVVVGPTLRAERAERVDERGARSSCIGVVATDIPLDARQLGRVARRVGLGLARVGSVAHHGSGDIFIAFSTTNRLHRSPAGRVSIELLADGSLDDVFTAVVDATEEAVCNALFVADTVTGVEGHVAPGLPVARVVELVGRAQR